MRLSYKSYGDGPVVVLLHGVLGSKENRHAFAASIRAYFPQAVVRESKTAGHWVHADAPREFGAIVRPFLEACVRT